MSRNHHTPTTRARRAAIAMVATLATVAMGAAGVAGQEPQIQPDPVEPPIVEPTEIGPVSVTGQSDGDDGAPSQDLIAGLDNTYLRGIAGDWQTDVAEVGSDAVEDALGCVDGPSRSITIC